MVQIFVRFGFCFWPLGSVQLKFNNAVRESSFRSLVGQRCWPSGLLASRPRDSGSCISIAEPLLAEHQRCEASLEALTASLTLQGGWEDEKFCME